MDLNVHFIIYFYYNRYLTLWYDSEKSESKSLQHVLIVTRCCTNFTDIEVYIHIIQTQSLEDVCIGNHFECIHSVIALSGGVDCWLLELLVRHG